MTGQVLFHHVERELLLASGSFLMPFLLFLSELFFFGALVDDEGPPGGPSCSSSTAAISSHIPV